MGGGGGTQKTRTEPWRGQQPYLQDVFKEAYELYGQGPQQYYPGQTVAGFDPVTQQALSTEVQRATQGDPTQRAMGSYLTGTLLQPQVDPGQIAAGGAQAMGNLGLASRYLQQAGQAPTFGQAAGMAGVGGGPPVLPGMGQLGATAGGAFMPGRNPYLDQMYQTGAQQIGERFAEDIMPQIAGGFGAAGRTGSGAQALMTGRAAGDVAGELAGLYGDIYAPAYEAERGRQMAAAGQLGQLGLGMGQQDIARRQLAADIYGGGLGRMAGVGGQLGTLGLGGLEQMRGLYGDIGTQGYRAAQLAPTYQAMQYRDIDRLLRAGGQREDQAQRMIDAARARWEFQQQAPYQALGQYANLIQGMPAGYGTTRTTGGGGSRVAGALGGGMAGAQMGAMAGGPFGAAVGGGLGGLAGLFM